MHEDRSLEGRVAIITGGARGQGAADARLLSCAGAFVLVTDLLEDEGQALCREIGESAVFVRHDVTNDEDWQNVVSTALGLKGRLDVLVNNAGIHWSKPLREESVEGFETVLAVNLIGPFLGIRAVSGAMEQSGGGSIINISSTAGPRAFRDTPPTAPQNGDYGVCPRWRPPNSAPSASASIPSCPVPLIRR